MQLGALIDDGLVAWINGYEVLGVNPPPAPLTTNSSASGSAGEPPPFVIYNLPSPTNYLKSATNVLTIQVFNVGIGSSDIGFDANLSFTVDVSYTNNIVAGFNLIANQLDGTNNQLDTVTLRRHRRRPNHKWDLPRNISLIRKRISTGRVVGRYGFASMTTLNPGEGAFYFSTSGAIRWLSPASKTCRACRCRIGPVWFS